jgi:uroporphyrinogen decarboxylase
MGCLEKTGYDHLPVKHEGTPEINQALKDHFGLRTHEQLLRMLGDDFRYVEPIYRGPPLRTFPDGSCEGYWGERYRYVAFEGGRYLEASFLPFAGVDDPARLDRGRFPSAAWFDFSSLKEKCQSWKGEFALCFGSAGDMDFINSIARARGVEQVLMDLAMGDPVFLTLMDARFRFYYELHEQALRAAGGLLDIMHVGEDLGHQQGPLIGMPCFETFFAPRYKAYFEMVHGYGARVMMHMCGCVASFLPRLIELGLDILDVVQPATPEMEIGNLGARFGGRLCFCGTLCVQTTLPWGSEEDVRAEVRRRRRLFPKGGLILGPTHAIQVGTPVANILALYGEAGSLAANPALVLDHPEEISAEPGMNMSKLF